MPRRGVVRLGLKDLRPVAQLVVRRLWFDAARLSAGQRFGGLLA
jgi:hypothetical protein